MTLKHYNDNNSGGPWLAGCQNIRLNIENVVKSPEV